LYLSATGIGDAGVEHLRGLRFRELQLDQNNLTARSLPVLATIPHLQKFNDNIMTAEMISVSAEDLGLLKFVEQGVRGAANGKKEAFGTLEIVNPACQVLGRVKYQQARSPDGLEMGGGGSQGNWRPDKSGLLSYRDTALTNETLLSLSVSADAEIYPSRQTLASGTPVQATGLPYRLYIYLKVGETNLLGLLYDPVRRKRPEQ
jgi:hypothetical protein